MLHPHPDGAQLAVKFNLGFGQLAPFGLFERRFQGQARQLIDLPGVGIDQSNQGDLISQALIAFIRPTVTAIGQPFDRFSLVTQFFVVFGSWHALTDRLDVVVTIGYKLSFAGKLFFLPE